MQQLSADMIRSMKIMSKITTTALSIILFNTLTYAGIVVQLGWDGVKNAEALLKTDNTIVQILETGTKKVAEAREDLMKKGLYGRITVETFDGKTWPYVDDLVNQIVETRTK